jgi:hypothetical protein
MVSRFFTKVPQKLRKWLGFGVFLSVSTLFLLLASTVLLKDASADILLIVIIWCLPLFIH